MSHDRPVVHIDPLNRFVRVANVEGTWSITATPLPENPNFWGYRKVESPDGVHFVTDQQRDRYLKATDSVLKGHGLAGLFTEWGVNKSGSTTNPFSVLGGRMLTDAGKETSSSRAAVVDEVVATTSLLNRSIADAPKAAGTNFRFTAPLGRNRTPLGRLTKFVLDEEISVRTGLEYRWHDARAHDAGMALFAGMVLPFVREALLESLPKRFRDLRLDLIDLEPGRLDQFWSNSFTRDIPSTHTRVALERLMSALDGGSASVKYLPSIEQSEREAYTRGCVGTLVNAVGDNLKIDAGQTRKTAMITNVLERADSMLKFCERLDTGRYAFAPNQGLEVLAPGAQAQLVVARSLA